MRTLIRIAIIVLLAVIGYNYFFGSSDEKLESKEIVDQVKDLGKSIAGLVISEKEKIEEGKYDGLFDKIQNIFETLKSYMDADDETRKEELRQLEQDKQELEEKVKNAEEHKVSPKQKEGIEIGIRELLEKAELLLEESNEHH